MTTVLVTVEPPNIHGVSAFKVKDAPAFNSTNSLAVPGAGIFTVASALNDWYFVLSLVNVTEVEPALDVTELLAPDDSVDNVYDIDAHFSCSCSNASAVHALKSRYCI